MQHPYCYPGTEVLCNKLDIRDYDDLQQEERTLSAWRLEKMPTDLPISPEGYQEIHRYMFQDLYDWAGNYRDIDTGRTGTFCRTEYIDLSMEKCFDDINAENKLRGLDADIFAERAAEYIGELNAIHPFLDGNGRTLRSFLEILGEQAGHDIDLARVEPDAWNHASVISFHNGDNSLLSEIISQTIIDQQQSNELENEGGPSAIECSDPMLDWDNEKER